LTAFTLGLDWLLGLLVGLVAVPLALIANDLVAALQAATKATRGQCPALFSIFARPPQRGAVVPARLTSLGGTMDHLRQCATAVFLVHGFNVGRADAMGELQEFGASLPAVASGAAVAVLWPGDSIIGPLSHPFETNKADDSAVELAIFIADNLPQRPAIFFVGHSLGCRVVMETVRQLWIKGTSVGRVCVMGAAIDNDSLGCSAEYFNAAQDASRVGVLYSLADRVLEYVYPPGNLLSAFLHWTSTTDAALGYTRPRSSASPLGPFLRTLRESESL